MNRGSAVRRSAILEKLAAFLLALVAISRAYTLEESVPTDSTPPGGSNCSTTDSFLILRSRNETREGEMDTMAANVIVDDGTGNDPSTVVSRPRTFTSPKDRDERPGLKFPKFTAEERYKMASLHLDKGWFAFDFLRGFLSLVQPYDIPTGEARRPQTVNRANDFRAKI